MTPNPALKTKIKIELTQFYLFTKYNTVFAWQLVKIQILNKMFYKLIDLKRFSIVYVAGAGNYIINLKYSCEKGSILFQLPSKQVFITSDWVLGLPGRNVFTKIKEYIAPKKKKLLKKSIISVRGVAKNPVDHHNGGRNKRKPLFLNKYNKIAKYGK